MNSEEDSVTKNIDKLPIVSIIYEYSICITIEIILYVFCGVFDIQESELFLQGARYANKKLYEVANGKYFDVPCDSKYSFLCSVLIGGTDLAITSKNVYEFEEHMKTREINDTGKK